MRARVKVTAAAWKKQNSKKRAHKPLSLEEKPTILDELSSKTHRQLAEIRHLYMANTHYNWASEASPTLGCSIEISRDIYIYMSVCLSWSKKA